MTTGGEADKATTFAAKKQKAWLKIKKKKKNFIKKGCEEENRLLRKVMNILMK